MIKTKCIDCKKEIKIYGKKTLLSELEDGTIIDCYECEKEYIVEKGELVDKKSPNKEQLYICVQDCGELDMENMGHCSDTMENIRLVEERRGDYCQCGNDAKWAKKV